MCLSNITLKIKILDNDTCSLCNNECETILHMFCMCEKVLHVWSELSLHIYATTSKRTGFNVRNIMFGELPFVRDNYVINFIILYTKQYIFRCFKSGKQPHLLGLIPFLKTQYSVEKYVYVKNESVDKFNSLWEQWKALLEI